jgi:DNA-binding CsgD family transcriptional regulator
MQDEIRRLLEQGESRVTIARKLGVSPSTVTRYARKLGFPDARKRRSPFDWAAIQRYYDEGHTIDECRARFGFSYGAWDKAAIRGDVVARPRSARQLSHLTRDSVEQLLARGRSQGEISRELGVSKSTVAYHCRRLGRRADPRFAIRYEWAEVQQAIDVDRLSMRQCLQRFGFARSTWDAAVARGDIQPRDFRIPLEDLLVAGRRTSRHHLKQRLVNAGLKESRCEACGITEWRGEPLAIELHHKNGDGTDNRLANLEFLCPNCHSQTDTWGGRNGHRKPERHLKLVGPVDENDEDDVG